MGIAITGDTEADQLLTDDPFALVMGMLLDQQFPMERAFSGPARLRERFGSLDPAAIADADADAFADLCAEPPAVHRYARSMAGRIQALARIVVDDHDGDVTRLWTEATSGKDLLKRIKALPGFGEQKAKILLALLAKQKGVQPEGWQEAAGDYALAGYRSVADVVDPDSLQKVRAYKKEKKAAAK